MIKKNLATVKIGNINQLHCDYLNKNKGKEPDFMIIDSKVLQNLLDNNEDNYIIELNYEGKKVYRYGGINIAICDGLKFGEVIFV